MLEGSTVAGLLFIALVCALAIGAIFKKRIHHP